MSKSSLADSEKVSLYFLISEIQIKILYFSIKYWVIKRMSRNNLEFHV